MQSNSNLFSRKPLGKHIYRFGKRIAHIIQEQLFQPMKKQMTLSTDRKSAAEGEYIEIRWACDACPDSLFLSIDSGCTQYNIAVSDSGTTRIPVPRSNGKMTVQLICVISRTKAPLSARMKMFGEKMQAKWYVFRAQMKYWWLSQKKWQKALWIALLVLWLGLLFSSIGRKPEAKGASDQVQTAYLIR